MNVFCLSQFKIEVEKLRRKNSYSSIDSDIIDNFINKTIQEVQNGTRLNGNNINPYIKKRLDGRGGFRVYFLLIIHKNSVYLMFVHPKTGASGSDNINDNFKKSLYKDAIEAIETNNLFSVSSNEKGDMLVFNPME